MQPTIGFIGQGYVGKNYAADFENRGYEVIRYSREKYAHQQKYLKKCDIIFIAVPTPTTPAGFDSSIVLAVLPLVPANKIAVIKSTLLPGTTEDLQNEFPQITILHSPEFLTEATAAFDAAHPSRNIIGFAREQDYPAAELVLKLLPPAPYQAIVPARTAELIKYGANCFLYVKVVYANLLYDLSQKLAVDYDLVKLGLGSDPRIGPSHLDPIHYRGRGAGGHCFIKDFAAFARLYQQAVPQDKVGQKILKSLEEKNNQLLQASGKDLDLLEAVYGLEK